MGLKKQRIGIIGIGQMGGGIARNLVKAGYQVLAYDPRKEAQERFKQADGRIAPDAESVIESCDIILLCVEGKVSIKVTSDVLIPGMRKGQILIDNSTVPVPQTRRFGKALSEKGVGYLDAPVSGGASGADSGTLRIFVGGDRDLYIQCRPLFEAAGNPGKIHYYGPTGMGQVAKVVQQLTSRLPDTARLEVMAFGVRSGLDKRGLMNALDTTADSDNPYAQLYRYIEEDNKNSLEGLFSEWQYYIEQLRAIGMRMPMLEGLYEFAKDAEKTATDPLGRREPCIWDELMKYREE